MAIGEAKKVRQVPTRFAAGVVAGVLFGTATLSVAGLGLKAWKGNPAYLQAGYISGFTDAVRIARAQNSESYLALTYPLPSHASTIEWQKEINRLYEDPKFAEAPVSALMAIAGRRLVSRYGALSDSQSSSGLQRLGNILSRNRSASQSVRKDVAELLATREKQERDRRSLAQSIGLSTLDWNKLSAGEQRGYIEGFGQCISISKYTAPNSYLSNTYRSPKTSDLKVWKRTMREYYALDKSQSPVVLMAWVGSKLAKTPQRRESTSRELQERYLERLTQLISNAPSQSETGKKLENGKSD